MNGNRIASVLAGIGRPVSRKSQFLARLAARPLG